MIKNTIVEFFGELVCKLDNDCIGIGNIGKLNCRKKRAQMRKRAQKKKVAPPWLWGAPHDSPPLSDLCPRFLTSTIAFKWRILGYNADGDGDARSKSIFEVCKFLCF